MRLPQHCVRQSGRSLGRRSVLLGVLLLVATTCLAPGLLAQRGKNSRAVVFTVTPEYPETLQRAKIGGLVRLSASVAPDGKVSKVKILGGNPILVESAVTAVMKWKYAPGPVETNEEISLSFSPH
jgi:TonB family protein